MRTSEPTSRPEAALLIGSALAHTAGHGSAADASAARAVRRAARSALPAARSRGVLVAGLLMLSVSVSAGAARADGPVPGVDAASLLERARGAEVHESTRDAFLSIVGAAVEEGLPVEHLAAKFLEGISKNVPEARVLAAVRTVSARLDRAAALLRVAVDRGAMGPISGGDIARVAAGLTAGVPQEQITLLLDAAAHVAAPVARGAEAVGALERLRAMGVYDETAAMALAAAVAEGRSAADFRRMAEDYSRHAAANGDPAAFFGAGIGEEHRDLFSRTGLGYDAAGRLGAGVLPTESGSGTGTPGIDRLTRGGEGERDPYSRDRGEPPSEGDRDDPIPDNGDPERPERPDPPGRP